VVVGTLVVVVVVGGGQVPKRGAHARMKRSRSVPPGPRAVTRIASLPGRWRSSGPLTGTITSATGPHPGPARDAGAATSPPPTFTERSAGGGGQRAIPSSLMHTRTAKWPGPAARPARPQRG